MTSIIGTKEKGFSTRSHSFAAPRGQMRYDAIMSFAKSNDARQSLGGKA